MGWPEAIVISVIILCVTFLILVAMFKDTFKDGMK